jgi:hypothetical protein
MTVAVAKVAGVSDVTACASQMASPAAGSLTGTSLVVDGGWTAR